MNATENVVVDEDEDACEDFAYVRERVYALLSPAL